MTETGSNAEADARVAEANARKAEADAQTAELAAAKVKREEEEAAGELARQRREAEARRAIAEADKAARDAAVHVDPSVARQQKEAEAKKATADADKAAADARQAQISALIPDFSKIQVPETKLSGDVPLFGSVLGHRALADAAEHVVAAVEPLLPTGEDDVVLVTNDEDLAGSDGAYVEVTAGMDHLIAAAESLLATDRESHAFAAAAGALMSAVPGLVSLLVPRQTITSRSVEVDTTAAIAQVVGRLAGRHRVRLDDFRLIPTGHVVARERQLREARDRLVRSKLQAEAERSEQEVLRTGHQKVLDGLTHQRDALSPGTQPDPELTRRIDGAQAALDAASTAAKQAGVKVGLVDDLVKAIDAFSIAIHAVPQGGKRSPFVAAALHEELRNPKSGSPGFAAILFLKASSGSADQVFEERLLFNDKFEGVASASLSYWLVDPRTSYVMAAGVATGASRIQGEIGGRVMIKPVETLDPPVR